MDPEVSRTKMREEVDQVGQSAMAQAFGWGIEVDDLVVFVTLRHRRRPEQTYLLRVGWDDFPRRAPSCLFANRETREPDLGAWPPNVMHSPSPPGICTPGTREFHEHYHRGDAQYPWDPGRYPFLSTLQEIHRMMERGMGG